MSASSKKSQRGATGDNKAGRVTSSEGEHHHNREVGSAGWVGHHVHTTPHGEHGHTHGEHGHTSATGGGNRVLVPEAGRPAGLAFRASPGDGAESPPLLPGAGANRILYFDAFSGAAGDMIVAALIDLGVPLAVVEDAVGATGISGYELKFERGHCGSIGACKFDVAVADGQPQRSYADIRALLAVSRLPDGVRVLSERIFLRLAKAEAEVHRVPVESVHFHEVGAVDSIVDIVAAAACFEHLGANVWVSPLPLGRGFIDCQHGRIPLPAPATINCLKGLLTCDAGIQAELVTPTAAAILGTIATRSSSWPEMVPMCVGWGAGTRALSDRPNALRVVLGDTSAASASLERRKLVVLEANLDDSTGELLGHMIGALIEAGALDAWVVPTSSKKGRPGYVLCTMVEPHEAERVASLILAETTTLGVRRHWVERTERPRRFVTVSTCYGPIAVKVSEGPYGPAQIKPEFDVCVSAARANEVPVREVLAEAMKAAREALTRPA